MSDDKTIVTRSDVLRTIVRTSSASLIAGAVAALLAGLAITVLLALVMRLLGDRSSVPNAPIVFGMTCFVIFSLRLATHLLLIRLTARTVDNLRRRVVELVIATPYRDVERLGTPRILAVLNNDISTIVIVIPLLAVAAADVGFVLAAAVYFMMLSPSLLVSVAVLTTVAVIAAVLPIRRARRWYRKARDHENAIQGHFEDATSGLKELVIHSGRRQRHRERFGHDVGESRRYMARGDALFALADSAGEVLGFCAIGVVLFAGHDWLGLDAIVLAGFVVAMTYMMGPLRNLVNLSPHISRMREATSRIDEIGTELRAAGSTAEQPVTAHAPLSLGERGIELAEICHTYESDGDGTSFRLGPIDLLLQPGKITFVVGGNGSGKSTLAKLVTGLYPLAGGDIYVGGTMITGALLPAYRELFSVVFSDFHQFLDLPGVSAALEERAREKLKLVHLDTKVDVANGAFSTKDLSQGQKGRLALATALTEDRPVYVFDEIAAHQDTAFKRLFYRQILPALRAEGKTILVITHDDEYFDVADEVVKLRDGRRSVDDTRQFMRDLHDGMLNADRPAS